MLEQRELSAVPGKETLPISKVVVVLFPDARTTGDFERRQDEYVPFLAQRFRDTTSLILKRYKKQGYRTFGLVYQDTDESNFSYLYPQQVFDDLIVWNKSFRELVGKQNIFHELYRSSFPQFRQELNLENSGEVMVGGYHAGDCVYNFAGYLKSCGYKTRVDFRLTDELTFLLISHRLRQGMPKGILQEHMKWDLRHWENTKQRLGSF